MNHILGVLGTGEKGEQTHTSIDLRLLFGTCIPEQMSGNGGSIHSDSGGWQHHRVRHECAHDGIQELITGVCVGLLLLLLEVS